MKMTFRWFGENSNSMRLSQIKQTPGMTGLVGFPNYKAAGEVWMEEEAKSYTDGVHVAGLEYETIESVNVHEDIKMGLPSRDEYVVNYNTAIRHLVKYGVEVIVYNFMPVLDWLRTDLARPTAEDGSNSPYFDEKDLGTVGPLDLVRKATESCNGLSLPGWEPERLVKPETILEQYEGMTLNRLRENYKYLLDAVIPVCEEVGIKMACHPDDPAWPIFGLPRTAHGQGDFDKTVALHDSSVNAPCLCTGSLGSNLKNDIPAVIRHFGETNRIACLHIRNVKYLGYRNFCEASHLSYDGDPDMFTIMKAVYDTCSKDVYVRPDHGRMIWSEVGRPGYGLYDRALGATYLNGLWEAIDKMSKQLRHR